MREVDKESRSAMPQDLLLGFFGLILYVFGDGRREEAQPVPTHVFLSVLSRLGISETATRATLNRMVRRGLLTSQKQGRASLFHPTEAAQAVLRRGRDRALSPTPFEHAGDMWTVLSCPVPETLRNVRYNLQVRLSWAGFGVVHPNVWIAPGQVDVEELLGDLLTPEALSPVQAFYGAPAPPASPARLVREAWDLESVRAGHLEFLACWEAAEPPLADALAQFLLVLDDWSRLVRADPGLPAIYLEEDWPAHRSTRTFQRLRNLLVPLAEQQFRDLLNAKSHAVTGSR